MLLTVGPLLPGGGIRLGDADPTAGRVRKRKRLNHRCASEPASVAGVPPVGHASALLYRVGFGEVGCDEHPAVESRHTALTKSGDRWTS